MRFLVNFDPHTLLQVYACLVATDVKPAVVSPISDILDLVLAFSTADGFIAQHVVKPRVSLLLINFACWWSRPRVLLSYLVQSVNGSLRLSIAHGHRSCSDIARTSHTSPTKTVEARCRKRQS